MRRVVSFSSVLVGICFLFSLHAHGQSPLSPSPAERFTQELQTTVAKATRKRLGLLLLVDLTTGQEQIFGEGRLLNEKFLPGSLMKLVTAEAALPQWVAYQWNCPGHTHIGGTRLTCWTYHGHQAVDLASALAKSCNLYFARLVQEVGWARWLQQVRSTPFSAAQQLPEKNPSPLELAQLAIGDSPNFFVTPREMMQYWKGLLPRLKEKENAVIGQGLRQAVETGTAKGLHKPQVAVLAKTGTGDSMVKAYPTNGWFLGAYPADTPRWAWLILMQEAHGFQEPTQLAKSLLQLALRYGIFSPQ